MLGGGIYNICIYIYIEMIIFVSVRCICLRVIEVHKVRSRKFLVTYVYAMLNVITVLYVYT